MKTSDFILTFFIILIFIGLYLFNILGIGIKNIQDNWPLYRCNPAVVPFAGLFNQNVSTNFAYCIQNMQTSYMDELLKPIHYTQHVLGEASNEITNGVQDIREFFNKIRTFILQIVSSIMGVFLNLLIEIQKILIATKSLFAKLVGVAVTFAHVISGSAHFSSSVWEGPPGKTMRAVGSVCFHPDTRVKKYNNKIVKMKNLKLGDKLKNGQMVRGLMNIHNLDENNNYIENMYYIKNGEKELPIIVSGSHLIFDTNINNFIHVKDYENAIISDTNLENLFCLITSDHTIPLGNYIFHDWEDNNGSISKNI